MNEVNNYVNVLRQQGSTRVNSNPQSENSLLKTELAAHYKNNPLKAWALINGIESNNFTNVSAEQRLHYDAAVLAMRGYSNPTPTPSANQSNAIPPKEKDMNLLKSQGWKPLNEVSEPVLLVEKQV